MRPLARVIVPLLAALLSTACSRELGIPAKNPLAIEPPSRTLAPRQQITFTSRGGAGGYTYRFHGGVAGSSADALKASLDPATGAYQAGPVGPATDVVEVVDRAGSLASATITIGPQLTLTPGAAYPPPGGGATLVAHGGLPPYDYAFAPRSNRSGGSVDHVTGAYSAGGNPGTIDLLQVTDAAGAVSQVSLGIVGSRQVAVPGGAAAIEVGDLNGDGLEDLLFLAPDVGGARRLSTWSFPRGSAPLADTYWTPAGTAALGVWDLEGTGRSDVAVVGPTISVLRADLGGALSLAGPLGTPASGSVAAGPWFANGGPCVASRLAWGVSGPVVPTACPPSVLPQPSGAPQAMATGNFAGAGGPDVAWVEGYFLVGPSQTKINDPKIRFGLASDTSPTPLTLPSVVGSPGTSADVKLIGGAPLTQQIARLPTGTAAGDGAVVLMANVPTGSPATPAAANLLGYIPPFAATPAWAGWTPFDPFPGQSPTMGVAGCGPLGPDRLPSAVAWNGGIAVTVADLSATTVHLAPFLADQYPVGVAACADVDGDGFPDLITASAPVTA
jgi:hypothetical protein